MHGWLLYLLSFSVAAGVALWLTPKMRDAALRFGIVDRPDGRLKTQRQPVPYLGGVAIYLTSDASSYHSGDSFVIDGGYSIF